MTYKGIRVKLNEVELGKPVGISLPSVTESLEVDQIYTLQWKHCNKTPHDILNYIYVGDQNLGSIDLTTFKTVDIVEDYQEKLCFIEFISNKTISNPQIKIGRIQDGYDVANSECFLIRDPQLEKGYMTDYKPNATDDIIVYEKLKTEINQTNSKINIMAKKTELDKLKNQVSYAQASIAVQAGLIENKVEYNEFSTLVRQSPYDIQYAFNGINPRYIYTNDGFYMKADNGNNKASFKRGSFYCYNYKDGTFLGGLTPIVFEGENNAGTGIINSFHSAFFAIGKDSKLMTDEQDVASEFATYLALNFKNRPGSDINNFFKYGLQFALPVYFHDHVNFGKQDLNAIKTVNTENINATETVDMNKVWSNIQHCSYLKDRFGYWSGDTWINGNDVFYFGEHFCTNYRNWDWGGMNLTNCNWVGSFTQPSLNAMFLNYNNENILDDIEVVHTQSGKLGLTKIHNPFLCMKSNLKESKLNETFEYEQLIYSLIKEVKELKHKIDLLESNNV